MGDVVLLAAIQHKRDQRTEDLWAAYLAAQDKAKASGDINDGIAAGKAWAAWLDHFRAVSS